MKKAVVFGFFFVLIFSISVYSECDENKFKQVTTNQSFIQDYVLAMVKCPDKFIWFETEKILDRSGYEFNDPFRNALRHSKMLSFNEDVNRNGKEGTSVLVVATPPFWKTWWFKLLSIAFFAFLLFAVYSLRMRQIENHKMLLKRVVAERTREIQSQKEEIESQYEEIRASSEEIISQKNKLEEAQKVIKEKNEKLEAYNAELENMIARRTEQLRKTLANLEETNKELDQFIYRSAHDLRGPVASVMGLVRLGELETNDSRMIELLNKMECAIDEMDMKLSRLMKVHEISIIKADYTLIDLEELIEEVVTEVVQEFDSAGVQIVIECDNKLVSTDAYLLKILLRNVIENSVKFKDTTKTKNYVRVLVATDFNETVISVIDNGIGVPEKDAYKIFDLFVVASERSRGFGIGLYESKLIARRLNGNIELKFRNNQETEFAIRLAPAAT